MISTQAELSYLDTSTQINQFSQTYWTAAKSKSCQLRKVATTVTCTAPATCGELIQGTIDGQDFLINCPIDLYSTAQLRHSKNPDVSLDDTDTQGNVADALKQLTPHLRSTAYSLNLTNPIPRSKGMGSSSADISAITGALLRSGDLNMDTNEISKLMARVGPANSVHAPSIAHINHMSGEIVETLPTPAHLDVLIVDCGREIHSLDFDREYAREIYAQNQTTLTCALQQLRKGLMARDNRAIAEAATRSAIVNQMILNKPQFGKLLQHSRACGALGVNCAHNGAVMGVMYEHSDELRIKLVDMIEKRFGSSLTVIGNHRIVSGGCHSYIR